VKLAVMSLLSVVVEVTGADIYITEATGSCWRMLANSTGARILAGHAGKLGHVEAAMIRSIT
jgi:hypothetical protein